MARSEYWQQRFKDNPTADQINQSLKWKPKRKISPQEQKKINDFVDAVGRRGKMILERQNCKNEHSD